ncbi:glycosyltransferase family 2 protein [Anaerosacchariphilus polymeriproducens]|uniref:Glycosyltransferase family 2 protein n=1 Tax=Anaerosacchariphilus polymeriproducens TaxID=1812858 RepID=A0A371ATA1_9FIRM|nr:glycosyltransferase family 2 protein [Anaerosacchariphilus polymeriproducens]RDU22807.1 glycosyltransferase family 2 protein [Anaerosacchariphilus polymeriproducens]
MQRVSRKDKIDIILPTYNGEKYIRDQIESIIGQDYTNWNLLIRDDGSKDQTPRIIREFHKKYPDKIHIIYDNKGNLGVTYNVFELLKYAKNPYIMFCDQDDIWKVNKIRTLFEYIKKVEKDNKNQPLLVHSDASIVDSKLKMIHPSFASYIHWDKRRDSLANLLQRNVVQGSSAVINQKLLEKVKILGNKKGLKTVHHDWWIAVVAATFGKIYYCNKALMLYRQHGNNIIGATSNTLHLRDLFHLSNKELNDLRYRFYLSTNPLICRQILKVFSNELTKRQKKILKHYEISPNNIKEFFELRLQMEFSIPHILGMILFTVG